MNIDPRHWPLGPPGHSRTGGIGETQICPTRWSRSDNTSKTTGMEGCDRWEGRGGRDRRGGNTDGTDRMDRLDGMGKMYGFDRTDGMESPDKIFKHRLSIGTC